MSIWSGSGGGWRASGSCTVSAKLCYERGVCVVFNAFTIQTPVQFASLVAALDRSNGTHPVIFYIFANFMHNYLFNGGWFLLLKVIVGKGGEALGKKKKS